MVTGVSHQSTSHFARHAAALTTNATTLRHSRVSGCCYENLASQVLWKNFQRPPEIYLNMNWSSNLIYLIKLFYFELPTILLPPYCGRVMQSNPELSDPLGLPSQFVLEIPSSLLRLGYSATMPFQHLHWGTQLQSSYSHIKYLTARPYFNTL